MYAGFNCDFPIFLEPIIVIVGGCALAMGALAWGIALPPSIARFAANIPGGERASDPASIHRLVWMLLGPLNGSVFVLVGLYAIVGTIQCHHVNLGIPDLGVAPAFTWWPGIYLATLIATGLGIYNTRHYRSLSAKVITIIAFAWFGLAGGEAAGFHVGPHAAQWFAAAIASWIVIGVVYLSAKKQT